MKLANWSHNGPTAVDSRANYMGDDLSDLLRAPVSRTRDSDLLDESNFATALDLLGGESDTVRVHRFGHWACGWYELLLIDPRDTVAVGIAEKLADRLASYPVLNEDHFSDLEWSTATRYWDDMSLRDRIDALARSGGSIFSARHPYGQVSDDDGSLQARILGN